MILLIQQDVDACKLMKANEEFAYMYVIEEEGPIWKKVEVSQVVRDSNLEGGSAVLRKEGCVDVATDGVENSGEREAVVVDDR